MVLPVDNIKHMTNELLSRLYDLVINETMYQHGTVVAYTIMLSRGGSFLWPERC